MQTKQKPPRLALKIKPEKIEIAEENHLVLFRKRSGRKRVTDRAKELKQFMQKYALPYHFVDLDDSSESDGIDFSELKKTLNITRIIVMGGDGTIRRVAEKLYFENLDLPIAIVPTGSANALGRMLGIDTFAKAKQAIIDGDICEVQAATLNRRHLFLIAAAFGQISLPAIRAHDYYKHYIGFLAYILAGIPALFRVWRTKVTLPESGEEFKAHSILVMPDKKLKFLEPFSRGTSKLTIIIYKGSTFWGFLSSIFWLLLRKREHEMVVIRNADHFTFTGDFQHSVHLDGDIILPEDNTFKMAIAEKPLKFLIPPQRSK